MLAVMLYALGLLAVVVMASIVLARLSEARERARLVADDTFAIVDGARIRYRLLTPAATPLVVLLNGMSSSLEEWRQVQDAVATFAAVLAYDRGGSGFSSGSRAHTADAQAQELAALLERLELTGPIIIVGYSVSASLARMFVDRHRSRMVGLVLLDPYLPELDERMIGRHGPFRMYARRLLRELVVSFFGLSRLTGPPRQDHSDRESPSVRAKAMAVSRRFPHWLAILREVWAMPSVNARVKTAGGLAEIPIVIVSGASPATHQAAALVDQVYGEFVAQSPRGRLEIFAAQTHSDGLDVGASGGAVLNAVRSMVNPGLS